MMRLLDVERIEAKEAFGSLIGALKASLCSALLATSVAGDGVGDGDGGFSPLSILARLVGGSLVLGLKNSVSMRLPVEAGFGMVRAWRMCSWKKLRASHQSHQDAPAK